MALIHSIKLPSLNKELKNGLDLKCIFEELYQIMLELKEAISREYFKITQNEQIGNSIFIHELSESLVPITTASLKTKVYINKAIAVLEKAYTEIQKFVKDFINQLKQCQETSNSKTEYFRKIYLSFTEYSENASKIVMTNVSTSLSSADNDVSIPPINQNAAMQCDQPNEGVFCAPFTYCCN